MPSYLFRPDLDVLAQHLRARDGESWSSAQAESWLTLPVLVTDPGLFLSNDARRERPEEPSPFRRTDAPGVLYSDEDPLAWLEPDEVAWVRETTTRPFQTQVIRAARELQPASGE